MKIVLEQPEDILYGFCTKKKHTECSHLFWGYLLSSPGKKKQQLVANFFGKLSTFEKPQKVGKLQAPRGDACSVIVYLKSGQNTLKILLEVSVGRN